MDEPLRSRLDLGGAEVRTFASEAWAAEVARRVAARIRERLEGQGRFALVLTGGSTPRPVYEKLAAADRRALPWSRVHFFWTDERCVAPDHADSNFGMASTALLEPLGVKRDQIHRIPAEEGPVQGALRYEDSLRAFFGSAAPCPAFDLALLGLGSDGHVASLFPGAATLREPVRWTASEPHPGMAPFHARVTLTMPALNAAREAWFLVTGATKRDVVQRLLAGQEPTLPAALVRPRVLPEWLIDADAAPGRSPDPIGGEARGRGTR